MSLQTPDPSKKRNIVNMTLAVFAGQVGCVTLVIVLIAIFGGMALDGALNTRPWITIALVVLSVPVSLYIMFQLAAKTIAKMQSAAPEKKSHKKEEHFGGEDS